MRNVVLSLFAASMLAGCVTAGPNQTGGAVVGGVAGGVLGSMFGGGTGRLVGTGLGAAIGTAVGSSVGASMDRQEQMQNQPVHQPYTRQFNSSGEESAYNRGRAEREAQIQQRREQDAYMRGLRGY